jgi:CRISPR-associated protein Csd2
MEDVMESLSKKIDFAVVISVKHANPNGDPLNSNRPRVNYDGTGEMSDVCIKRKIRNRLMEVQENGKFKHQIFVQSDDNRLDNYRSLSERAKNELGAAMNDEKKLREEACKKWIDVRAFGQVFAFKGAGKKKDKNKDAEEDTSNKGVSVGIRGPVSIHPAFSVVPVNDKVTSIQITKSVSGEGDGSKRGSDTMGMKHRVDHGLYVSYGSMNPQLATKTGFSDADATAIKEALRKLFENDASSARPEGSMEVVKLFWWEQNGPNGKYSSAKVHRTLKVELDPKKPEPKRAEDYIIKTDNLEGLKPEIIDGL